MNASAPLVPPDTDVRGYQALPLDVTRLLTSETWIMATLAERGAMASLWAAAWQQVPAGSLPDNDRVLAHLSMAGAEWPAVKDMALRGWVKCSDGRLYHPVVCEKAMEAVSCRGWFSQQPRSYAHEARRLTGKTWTRIRASIFSRDGHKCTYCGSADRLECDHVMPLSLGGTNAEANLVTSCQACNRRKAAKHPLAWRDA